MKTDYVKQMICISEDNAADFEDRVNDAIAHIRDPEITLDTNRPFTAYIIFRLRRDLPEDVLELFELVDGGQHKCIECPRYVTPDDKRKVWGSCLVNCRKTRADSRACEQYYILQYKALSEAKEKLKELPYTHE